MNTSESINQGLAGALAAAQAEMHNPAFDSTNPHFKSKFASLASVRNAVIPVLAKHGIAVIQDVQTTERGIACYTILIHSSGERVFGPLEMPASKADAQGFGSAITYSRRYSLQAIAGVVGDEDDDANGAVASSSKGKEAPASAKAVTVDAWDKLDEEERLRLELLASIVIARLNEDDDFFAFTALEEAHLSPDHRVAIWSRFDSKQRSRLKKQHDLAKQKPATEPRNHA